MVSDGETGRSASVPARPKRGMSSRSFTTMLRSASFAALERLRVWWWCCGGGPHGSSPRRVTLRMHDVHCGSSDGLVREAMARCGAAEALMARKSAAKRGFRDALRSRRVPRPGWA
jgi:hypothetical protein